MSEKTAIEWTDHTFNPWWGCAKVSPACDHCYAERDAGRYQPDRVLWGTGAERREFGDAHWKTPHAWARNSPAKLGRRPRVFCASMADVFDKNAPAGARDRLWQTIRDTPQLDWQLLTKRVGNVRDMLPPDWGPRGFANVWLGISVVTQAEAERDIPKLLRLPARIRFLSCEPLLAPIDLARWLVPQCDAGSVPMPGGGGRTCEYCEGARIHGGCQPLQWVIVGGESGPHARPMHSHWVKLIRDTCIHTGTAFMFKQWGEWRAPRTGDVMGPDRALPSRHAIVGETQGLSEYVSHFGKKAAGRELEGETWSQFPTVEA